MTCHQVLSAVRPIHGEWERLRRVSHSQVVKEPCAKVCVLLCKQKKATEGICSRELTLVLHSQVRHRVTRAVGVEAFARVQDTTESHTREN